MTDQTQTPDEEERRFLLHLTIPGPICGCPMTVQLGGKVRRPPREDMPPELARLAPDIWLFTPDQLSGFLSELNEQVMRAYALAMDSRIN